MKNKIFSNVIKRLKDIQKIEHLTNQEIKILTTPKKINQAKLKIGNKKFPAWRILFNDALGPGKGGIRFHSNVSKDEVISLAFWMMIKDSLVGLPYGGAKGGVKFDPNKASKKTLETVSRKFIDAFYKVLGQNKDIPAPDVYTNSQIMAWMLDEYEKKVGYHEPGVITGKPLELQGCSLRNDATAKGGFIIINKMLKEFKLDKKKVKVSIQGFGNAGLHISKMLWQAGFKVVSVSDSKGGTYNKDGLDIAQVEKIKTKTGSVSKYNQGEKITNDDLLESKVDILVLAALENQITKDNADKIKAKYIVELANGPISYEADQILSKKGITVVPDVLANAGGVIVSYFEWSQNKTGGILDKKYLKRLLEEKLISAWAKLISGKAKYQNKVDLRTVAYIIAIKRILAAEKARGRIK